MHVCMYRAMLKGAKEAYRWVHIIRECQKIHRNDLIILMHYIKFFQTST